MMHHGGRLSRRMWICIALVAVAAMALIAGLSGGWIVLPLLGCAAMMGVMVWMMGGRGHGGGGS